MKVVLIILDSVGVGELPDAYKYNDTGSNTILNIYKNTNITLPNMMKLGLGNIDTLNLDEKQTQIDGYYAKARELSKGKDTTTGHWEISGIILDTPFPTYPNGFDKELQNKIVAECNTDFYFRGPESGTEIIKLLGEDHMKTGKPIVYTSADSVFQIAAHEEVISVKRLYEICEICRSVLVGKNSVARVIARPFLGTNKDNFKRTKNRRDFSLPPTGKTMLDLISDNGFLVYAVGKIEDIFANQGITQSNHTSNNNDGITATIEAVNMDFDGLIFTNLVDFDSLYGHRNNIDGYAEALMAFDKRLPEIISAMDNDDILIISADHGCDPTTISTDHSREHIPILVYNKNYGTDNADNRNLGTRSSFSDISATILEILNIENTLGTGTSFAKDLK